MLYFYPNRPILIPPDPQNPTNPKSDYLDSLEQTGRFIAEQKWNGDNAMIFTGSKPSFWNRRQDLLKYQPSPEVLDELSKWPARCLLNAELVHFKTKEVKHTLIVHCIMTWKGQPLYGKTWGDSRAILEDQPNGEHVRISKIWKSGFWKLFQEADGKVIEGIILKDPKGKLVFSATPIRDVSWMKKVRKPCKKYSF